MATVHFFTNWVTVVKVFHIACMQKCVHFPLYNYAIPTCNLQFMTMAFGYAPLLKVGQDVVL